MPSSHHPIEVIVRNYRGFVESAGYPRSRPAKRHPFYTAILMGNNRLYDPVRTPRFRVFQWRLSTVRYPHWKNWSSSMETPTVNWNGEELHRNPLWMRNNRRSPYRWTVVCRVDGILDTPKPALCIRSMTATSLWRLQSSRYRADREARARDFHARRATAPIAVTEPNPDAVRALSLPCPSLSPTFSLLFVSLSHVLYGRFVCSRR